jgi:hypothetical protein
MQNIFFETVNIKIFIKKGLNYKNSHQSKRDGELQLQRANDFLLVPCNGQPSSKGIGVWSRHSQAS